MGELDSRIHVLGILAEDYYVDSLWMLNRGRNAVEIAYRPYARVEVQHLSERNVEAANTASHWSRQRTLDGNREFGDRVDSVVGQPLTELIESLFAGKYLVPSHPALAPIGFFHRCVEDPPGSAPDVPAGPVAFYKRDDGIVRDLQGSARDSYSLAVGWGLNAVKS